MRIYKKSTRYICGVLFFMSFYTFHITYTASGPLPTLESLFIAFDALPSTAAQPEQQPLEKQAPVVADNCRKKRAHKAKQNRHICTECNCLYSTPSNLRAHQARVHRKILNYVCNECFKDFFTSNELKQHAIVHTNHRFKCDQCDCEYTRLESLERHIGKKHMPQ